MFRRMPRQMPWKRKVAGGVLGVVGFMLSPLSWWNDAFVNLPLALAFAWLVSSPCDPLWRKTVFDLAVVVGYWLTNLLGFILMHKGARQLLSSTSQPGERRELVRDLWISVGYTVLIVVLIKLGVLKPVADYFRGN
jgi:hypothetical protein